MFVIPYIFILYFSYTILSYDFHILCFSYTVLSCNMSYTFRVIDTLFLVLVYLSYTFLFHILYLFIYFSCIVLCTFHILSYTVLCPFHILSCTMYFSYTVIFHILSSCTLLLILVTVYDHHIAVLCFSYHVIYFIHFICIYTYHFLLSFMSANTLEADTGNNCMYPKVLSLYEIVISIYIYPKVSSLYEIVTYAM